MTAITIPNDHLKQIVQHSITCLPEEACGLAGGRGGRVEVILPVENELHSKVNFRMAPQGQWQAFMELERLGLELLAIFHSHPAGPEFPSPEDVAEFAYPGVMTLIVSPLQVGWQVKAYNIVEHEFCEVELELAA